MPIRVAIVDDSPFTCGLLAEYLADKPGVKVIGSAHNGASAIELVKTQRPDVLTLDVEMPDADGVSVLRRLMRESPLPVVMVSGLSRRAAEITHTAITEGAVDFVLKYSSSVRHVSQSVGDSKNVASVWDPRSGERGNERKQATRFASSQSVTSVRQLVLFDLLQATASTERTCLALNVAQVQEITGPQSIASLPHAPTGVLGLIAWRGRAVPLLNLSATLGLPDHVAARLTRVVIVRRPLSDDHIAFVAPSAIRTQLLGKNQTTRRDDLCLDADRFFGAFTIGQETLLVPNLDQVFARGLSSIAV
jgi:DNA-binding NarL/FixJ family response regulator